MTKASGICKDRNVSIEVECCAREKEERNQ